MTTEPEISSLLAKLRAGRSDAMGELFPLVYEELRRIAHRLLGRGRDGDTLVTTALVHEAYLKLVDQSRASWNDRTHFLAVAATAMRQIVIDHARYHAASKRGHGRRRVSFDDTVLSVEDQAEALIALDDALIRLARLDQRLSRVVECRFFGGMSDEETAAALGITVRTLRRDWVKAKGLLYEEMGI